MMKTEAQTLGSDQAMVDPEETLAAGGDPHAACAADHDESDMMDVVAACDAGELVAASDGLAEDAGVLDRSPAGDAAERTIIPVASNGMQPRPAGGDLPSQATLEEALGRLRDSEMAAAPIVDDATGKVIGFLSRAPIAIQTQPSLDVVAHAPPQIRPGGMATPLGVYLTDGESVGGAGIWGLFLTGMVCCALMLIAQVLTGLALHYSVHMDSGALQAWDENAHPRSILRTWVVQSLSLAPLLFVFGMFRLIPLSGVHAAEHQVVHCVERGAPLRRDVVRQMPRVHPRCGTNLFTGFTLFLMVFLGMFLTMKEEGMSDGDSAAIAVTVAMPLAAIFWRRIGGLIQQWFVTRPATDKQIAGAIAAAEELLASRRARAASGRSRPNLLRRIWCMGLLQVSLGYFALYSPVMLLANIWPPLQRLLNI